MPNWPHSMDGASQGLLKELYNISMFTYRTNKNILGPKESLWFIFSEITKLHCRVKG